MQKKCGNYYPSTKNYRDVYFRGMKAFRESTSLIKQYYNFNDMELKAYKLYARILMISAPWNQEAFSEYLKNDKYKEKIIELLYLIEGVNLN